MFCNQCGNSLAEQDKFCRSCGDKRPPMALLDNFSKDAKKSKKWLLIPGGFLALIVVVGMIAGSSEDTAQANTSSPTTPPPPVQLTTIPVEQIINAYQQNAAGADQWLLHKRFIVTGTVSSIGSGIGDVPYVTFENPQNMFEHPDAHFENSDDPRIGELRRGQRVSLACTGGSSMIGIPMFDDCKFVE